MCSDDLTPGRDYVGVGVGAMVFNPAEQVFLARRGAGARNEVGTWEFPGGAVNLGEKLEDAVLREFLEEYGMKIDITGLLGIFDHILTAERQHWVSATYIARNVGGQPRVLETEKCSAIGWFDLARLPSPLSRITQENVEAFRKARLRPGTTS